jgi:glycosyltransferase involved in cell wall biosynthesis
MKPKQLQKLAFPGGSLRRKVARRALIKLGLRSTAVAGYYNTWVNQQGDGSQLHVQLKGISKGPLISVIIPAYNPPPAYFEELIYSVISQAYQNWELILINASSQARSKATINDCKLKDKRIRVFEVENNGISVNTNYGIKLAKGDYVAFVDHDDVLEPFALYEVALAIIDSGAELIYTDEDKISENGEIYFDPHFKPDWSPDLLTHVNYINHLSVIKKSLILRAGLLDPAKDGAQDYDLILRVTDLSPKIVHVPKVLYHWRSAQNSTAQDFSSKKNITDAGQKSLEEHFERQGLSVKAKPKKDSPGFYELKFQPYKRVSLVIAPFASDAFLRLYTMMLLERTSLDNIQVEMIVPTGGVQPNIKEGNLKITSIDVGSNFLEQAVDLVNDTYVVIISQVILPLQKDWLERLCGPLCQKHIASVAPLVIRNSSMIEDCGLVRDATGQLRPLFMNRPSFPNQTFFGNPGWVRDVDALTGSVVATSTKPLRQFIENNKGISYIPSLLRIFTEESAKMGKFNIIYTEVLLDNYAIRLKPDLPQSTLFNPNIFPIGSDYELYTPEASAINILTIIAEQTEKQ